MNLKYACQACLWACPCLLHELFLFWAMRWVKVLKGYAENSVSKKDRLLTLEKFLYWRKKCRINDWEFIEAARKWGYDLPDILRKVTNHQSSKSRSLNGRS